VGNSEFEGVPSAEWHVKRAYIIDDDDGFLKSLEFLLSSHGWKVDGFQSAKPFIPLERS
jgi:FixJ family two-component response regulator